MRRCGGDEFLRRAGRGGAVVAVGLILAGCVAIKQPPADLATRQLPTAKHYANKAGAKAALVDNWVAAFGSTRLSKLVHEALAANPDLHAAAARWEQAQTQIALAQANLMPQVNAGAGASRTDPGHGQIKNDFYAQVQVAWQADVWGEIRQQVASVKAQSAAARLDYRYARFSLAAAVARAWFTAIAARRQLAIDQDLLKLEQRTARITADKVNAGAGTQLDSEESKGNVALAQDAVAADRQALAHASRAIDVLLGRYPDGKLAVAKVLPKLPGPVPVGLPSQLLERRPDVMAANRRVASAFHLVESAKAAQLPQVNLSGSFGAVFDPTSLLWSIGGGLLQPLYAGGAIRGGIRLREAEQRQAVANYVSTGIAAFREVEEALSNERFLKQRLTALTTATHRLSNASRIAEDRYDAGIISILDLTQVRRQYFTARSQLLAVRSDRLLQRVNLYLALGGPPLKKKTSRAQEAAASKVLVDAQAATQPSAMSRQGSGTQPSEGK